MFRRRCKALSSSGQFQPEPACSFAFGTYLVHYNGNARGELVSPISIPAGQFGKTIA
jgi:hypothetical protein